LGSSIPLEIEHMRDGYQDCLRGSFTQHAPSAKVAWAFVLKSKDYRLEYEKEFPPCPAPTNLKTYRGFEALP
jgi:hypothetical protein